MRLNQLVEHSTNIEHSHRLGDDKGVTHAHLPIAAAAVLASSAMLATAGSASAAPDTACMQSGISTLKGAGLLSAVAKNGVPLDYAVKELGVTVRPGKEGMVGSVPNPVPFSVL